MKDICPIYDDFTMIYTIPPPLSPDRTTHRVSPRPYKI